MCIRNAPYSRGATRETALRLDEEKGAVMATEVRVVTYYLLGGLVPREVNMLWGAGRDATLTICAPEGAFAFSRSDRSGLTYLDGEVRTVEELSILGKHELVQKVIADGAPSAVRLKGTRLWAPYYLIDRVVTTSR